VGIADPDAGLALSFMALIAEGLDMHIPKGYI
jgi:hypothetical protein